MLNFKELFLLDPKVIYLNHGSYGATPRPVFETYQMWQRELERQPVDFFNHKIPTLMREARERLATYLGVEANEVVFFSNPTTALNMVARNLARRLETGDQILTSNHEYGALDRTWGYISYLTGINYLNFPIPIPMNDPQEMVEILWKGVTQKTKAIFLSHITSPTALTFPVREICQRARQQGILTIIDGAHAVGQIPINIHELGADIYAGACHKWLCAPKGSAFLYVRKEHHSWMEPLVVSWGYQSEKPSGNQYIDYHEWQGTRDLSAFLSVPAAIEFQREHDWAKVQTACHNIAADTRVQLDRLIGFQPLCPETGFHQMFASCLPDQIDPLKLKDKLRDEFNIEVPIYKWINLNIIRISIQAYNDPTDADILLNALQENLSELSIKS